MANINKILLSGTTYSLQDENAAKTVELTQAEYDALTVKDPNTFYIITDATGGDLSNYYTKSETDDLLDTKLDVSAYTPTDLSNYYTKSETSGATEISTALNAKADTATTYTKTEVDTALGGKQTTLTAGTGISIVDNVISATGGGGGGGKAIEAGRGISITTGETADTVSFNLPISAGTGTASIVEGGNSTRATGSQSHAEGYSTSATSQGAHSEGMYSKASQTAAHAEGNYTTARGIYSHAEGNNTTASGNYGSHAEGNDTTASGNYGSHAEGRGTNATNESEHASGAYNVSYTASTTWGDSGNTLFSVGNGTADNARHNAFEIRQNGDIYITSGGTDIKLQDNLGGGSITVDTALDSGSTNPVENRVIYNKIDEVEQVAAAGLNALNDNFGGLKLVKLTLAEYNALTTKDDNTVYFVGDSNGYVIKIGNASVN